MSDSEFKPGDQVVVTNGTYEGCVGPIVGWEIVNGITMWKIKIQKGRGPQLDSNILELPNHIKRI